MLTTLAATLTVGPSSHVCNGGGGIHPVTDSADGQILMSWPYAIALLRASGYPAQALISIRVPGRTSTGKYEMK